MTRLSAALLLAIATAPVLATEPVALQCGPSSDANADRMLDARTMVERDGRIAQVLDSRVDVPGTNAVVRHAGIAR